MSLDATYYGYRDEEDPKLLTYEEAREEEARSTLMKEAEETGGKGRWDVVDIPTLDEVPKQEEIEGFLLERRKQALLEKYQ